MELSAPAPIKPLPLPPNQKNYSLPALAALLVILLAASLYLAIKNYQLKEQICGLEERIKFPSQTIVAQPTPSTSLRASPTPDPAADWEAYTNTKFKYSVNYPNNLQIYENFDGAEGGVRIRNFAGEFPDDENFIAVGIGATENINGINLEGYFSKTSQGRSVANKDLLSVAGAPAFKVTYREEVGAGWPNVYFVTDKTLFSVNLSYGAEAKQGALLIFDQILATFRFLD